MIVTLQGRLETNHQCWSRSDNGQVLIIVASNPVLLQPLNQHHKSHGYGVVALKSPVHMLKEDWANQGREEKMGKRINWEAGNSKTKVYLNTDSETPGWRTILNTFDNINCQACTRRIKVGQKMLWHIESKAKMHRPQDCKMW